MKTISGIFFLLILTFLTSCESIPGPPGRDGEDGESFLGSVFEIQGDFTPGNEYTIYFEFPKKITVYESDVVLVYIMWEQADGSGGEVLDVWRLLPQTVVLDKGVLQYNYDYTFTDVKVFLEGTNDFNTLRPADTQDQVFRIVVLPAKYAKSNTLDVSDYNLMIKSLGVNPDTIEKMDITDSNHGYETPK